jgi:PAS domain S-box-containing protein
MTEPRQFTALLMERRTEVAELIKQRLSALGYQVAVAEPTEPALPSGEAPADVLFIGAEPGGEAWKTAQQFGERTGSPLVAILGDTPPPDWEEWKRLPLAAWVTPPLYDVELALCAAAAARRSIDTPRTAMLRSIVDGLLDSVLVVDAQLQVVFANSTATRTAGRSEAQLKGLPIETLFPPGQDQNPELLSTLKSLLAGGREAISSGSAGALVNVSGSAAPVVALLAPITGASSPLVSLSFRPAPVSRAETAVAPPLEPERKPAASSNSARQRILDELAKRINGPNRSYAVAFVLSQYDTFRRRFGQNSAEKLMLALTAHLMKHLRAEDRVLTWSSRVILVLAERMTSDDEVRLEIMSFGSRKIDYFLNATHRSAMVTLSSAWTIMPLFDGATLDKVVSQIESFESTHSWR